MKKFHAALTSLITLGTLAFVIGCGGSQPPSPSETPGNAPQPAAHAGHGNGPHGGTLADWGGGKYHVEFTVDHDKQEATVYVLGDDEKSRSPIKAEEIQLGIADPVMQVALKATPQAGDPAGTASRFVGSHPSLGVVQEYAGTITGVVDGTPYTGDFKEEPPGAHAH